MSIPAREGWLSRIRYAHPRRSWPTPKSVQDFQIFIRLSPHLDAQKSLSTDSSISATQIVDELDGVNAGTNDKSVEKLLKSRKIVKEPKKL